MTNGGLQKSPFFCVLCKNFYLRNALKNWLISIWLVCIAFQLVSKISFITWFEVHQEELTESCCVNRNKPKLNCNAKCFLVKNLNEIDQQESSKSSPNKVKQQNEEVWFFEEHITPSSFFTFSKTISPKLTFNYSHIYSIQVFQPPRA